MFSPSAISLRALFSRLVRQGAMWVLCALVLLGWTRAQAQSDTTPPAISLYNAEGGTTFSSFPTPLAGTVYDAGGLSAPLQIRLYRSHKGYWERWAGASWVDIAAWDSHWTTSLEPSGEAGTYNWNANVPWPIGDNLPDGLYTLGVTAVDNAGNRPTIHRTVAIGAPDATAPVVTIATPAYGELFDNVTHRLQAINGTIDDGGGSGVGYVEVYLVHHWGQRYRWWNGTDWSESWSKLGAAVSAPDAGGVQNWSVPLAALPPAEQLATGVYYLDAITTDRWSNWSHDRHVFNVTPFDGVAPEVAVTFPAEGQQLYNLPAIRGTARDDGSGVSQVNVTLMRRTPQSDGSLRYEYWNGDQWGAALNQNGVLPSSRETGWTRDQSLPSGAALPPGEYIVMVHALDRYDNVTPLSYRIFRIVATPPLSIDAHIRADESGAWLGQGFANADATGQTLTGTIESGATQTRQIRIVRNGGSGQSMTVRVTVPDWAAFAQSGWTARFTDAPQGADITGQITSANGWNTVLTDGGEVTIRVEARAPVSAAAGLTSALTLRVEADPTSETNALDVVKTTWNVTAPTPDLAIRAGSVGSWLGESVVNEDGAGQTLERVTKAGQTVSGQIKLGVSDAADGQAVKWSVPNAQAFGAGGWQVHFYDEPQGGNDITVPLSGAGWTTHYRDGQQPIIRFELTAPADASDVTRVLAVRAQIGEGTADVVKASVKVLPNVQPDVSISALDEHGLPGDWVGEGQLSPTEQRVAKVWGASETYGFAVRIKNTGTQATSYQLSWPDLPDGWELTLTNALEGGTPMASGEAGPITPTIGPNQSLTWRAEVTANVPAQQVNLPIRVSAGDLFDEVEVGAAMQRLVGIRWSRDGENWTDATAETLLQSQRYGTIGFRGVKALPDVGWPNERFGPTWQWQGVVLEGETVWLSPHHVTGAAGENVTATLNQNSFSAKIFVLPDVDLYLRAARGTMTAGATVALSMEARDENKAPLPHLRVRLRSTKDGADNGHFGDAASGEIFLLTDAQGNINTTWTTETVGRTQISVEAVDGANATFGEGDTWNMEVTN